MRGDGALIHHHHSGVQYVSIRRIKQLAEIINGLYKTDVIRPSWRNREAVKIVTLDWVYRFNHQPLPGPIGDIPTSGSRRGLLSATGCAVQGGGTQTKQPPENLERFTFSASEQISAL